MNLIFTFCEGHRGIHLNHSKGFIKDVQETFTKQQNKKQYLRSVILLGSYIQSDL